MSDEAVKEIQKSLDIIRRSTDKEQYSTKIKVLELLTQAMFSHLQRLEKTSFYKNTGGKKSKVNLPEPLLIPKSLNTPSSANNPNAKIPNISNTTSVSANDLNNMRADFMSNTASQIQKQ